MNDHRSPDPIPLHEYVPVCPAPMPRLRLTRADWFGMSVVLLLAGLGLSNLLDALGASFGVQVLANFLGLVGSVVAGIRVGWLTRPDLD